MKNTPFLYDFVIAHPLEWPSLTVQWVPLATPLPHSTDPSSFSVHKLVLGTHTSDDSPSHLLIAVAVLPTSVAEARIDNSGTSANSVIPKVEITQKIRVDGKAESKQKGCCDPDLRLTGHDKEGYVLSWSPFKQGYLVSGSHYNRICLWDVSAVAQDRVLCVVEDVSWHLKNENLFGSVGDDCQLIVWDWLTNQIQHSVKAHEEEITGMELSLGLWENSAAISVLVVSYVKCNGKSEDSIAVARAVIQHIILAAKFLTCSMI
ncbi:hypothetical protein SADUNF_Sadunf09G0110200 [Salix dunnii]|uniref:Histone-binding protein RBBP4-like N-terminal domain-containing protein n=1 Tax=Salix dunnii TaxID=1413687 RepID=A0A835JU15_9ROSI|nr:hypothetical protein SADUNF_Sadunf09G0110200 [Salix dunnii]